MEDIVLSKKWSAEQRTDTDASLEDNEIDGVAVAVDKQGMGYGKNMVSYSVNKLLDRGYKRVTLWVVEGNPAKLLYEKLGITTECTHEFAIKSIK